MATTPNAAASWRPRIAVSACLVGEPVRWDGRDKRDALIVGELAALADLVPVCPEVEVGLGVPREPIEIVRTAAGDLRLRGVSSGADHTERMRAYAEARVAALSAAGLDGWVLKARSPSCGLGEVPVVGQADGGTTSGRFAVVLVACQPDLPVVDEVALADPTARARFLDRVRDHARARLG